MYSAGNFNIGAAPVESESYRREGV